ncbi:MAG: Wzz/FepE/Etk N-terminal domain-containing protein, partial [Trueperaceae bacterium]
MTVPENYASDEISLRDLYLIVRRGMPLIAVVALLAGVTALLFVTIRGPNYQAETTVHISPTPVRVEGSEIERNLVLDVRNDVSWETYQTIAFSRTVLEDTLARLNDGDLNEADLTINRLRSIGDLEQLVGPDRSGAVAPMTIAHRIVGANPIEAARVANAWAEVTVETVQASLLSSLEAVRQATDSQLGSLEERLALAEDRWAEFQARDETGLLESRLAGLTERVPLAEGRLEEIERELAAARGARQALSQLQASSSGAAGADADGTVALLDAYEILPPETIGELTALLQRGTEDDLVSLIRQVELQRLTGEMAGLMAQRNATESQFERLRAQAEELRGRHAQLAIERDRLRQQLDSAQTARAELAALEPVLAYVSQLAPTNSRVLNPASVPTEPVGPHRLLVTTLAVLVGSMLALLFV